MFGIEESLARLAAMIALLGLVPSTMALAADRLREGAAAERLAGVAEGARRERLLFLAAEGRQTRLEAERCAPAGGEQITFTGHRDLHGEALAPGQMYRADGGMVDGRDRHQGEERHRLAAAAPVDALAAIAAAGREGYGAVTEVGWKHGAWGLRARDLAGAAVRLRVDGWTGRVAVQPY